MEVALRAALKAGIAEDLFWRLTPYNLSLRLQEIGRRNVENALFTGWMSERFAREERLLGPQTYIQQFLEPDEAEADAEAMADAEFNRFARQFGIDVIDLDPQSTEMGPSDSA